MRFFTPCPFDARGQKQGTEFYPQAVSMPGAGLGVNHLTKD